MFPKQAKQAHIDKMFASDDPSCIASPDRVVKTFIDHVGSDRTPYREAVFEERVRTSLGLPADCDFPGFSRYEDVFRQEQLRNIVVRGDTCIPKSKKFVHRLACPVAHPSLCATRDKSVMPQVDACTSSLFSLLSEQKTHTFWHLIVEGQGGYRARAWFELAHNRFGGPKLNLLCPATLNAEALAVEMERVSADDDGHAYGYVPAKSVVGQLFLAAGHDHAVEKIYVAPAPSATHKAAVHFDKLHVPDDWAALVVSSLKQVFPPRIHHAASVKAASYIDAKLVAGLNALSRPTRRRRSGAAVGIKIAGPKAADSPGSDAGSDGHSDAGSVVDVASDGDSDDGIEDVLRVAGHGPGGPGGPGGLPSGGAPDRHDRLIPFGPWTISEVWKKGTHIGYNSNCNCHYGSHLACRKQFTKIEGTLLEARQLAKCWLLMGLSISTGSSTGRDDHVFGIARDKVPLRPESDLDAEAMVLM